MAEERKVRRAAFAASLAALRDVVPEAVGTLREILSDPQLPAQVRISAARVVLDHAARSWPLSKEVEPSPVTDLLDELRV
jgi:hypothetical protein